MSKTSREKPDTEKGKQRRSTLAAHQYRQRDRSSGRRDIEVWDGPGGDSDVNTFLASYRNNLDEIN